MNIFLILLAALILYLGIQAFLKRAPKYGKAFLIKVGLIVLVVAIIALALSGRLHWLFGLAAGLLPFLRRLLPFLLPLLRILPNIQQAGRQQRSRQRSKGQRSEVTTTWLHMTLDHDSGEMEGQVLQGPYAGMRLDDLPLTDLQDLYTQCQLHDPDAIRLLDAYIQRHHADAWNRAYGQDQQQERQSADSAPSSGMSEDEAWEILGLKPGASREEIIKAHKRMMLKVHPDRGGSNYLASKINQAKEVLMAITS